MPKEKEVTIYDLARKLNISGATVSRALKNDPAVSQQTKKRIADLAEQMGYRTNHFARSLRNQRTHTIGVIIPRINSHFMSSVISGMEIAANEAGYNLIISQSAEAYEKEITNAKTLFNSRVDGLLVSLAYNTETIRHFESFLNKKIPLVFYDRVAPLDHCTRVQIDNKTMAYKATHHLIEQGCCRIAHVTAPSRQSVYAERLQGYQQALADAGLPLRQDYIIYNNLSFAAGAEAAARIMQLEPMPDGLFVTNDDCAVGCMRALQSAGIRIPHDIAVVGFNNDPVSLVVEPNLTTVHYPGYEMGAVAVRSLIDQLNGNTPPPDVPQPPIYIPSELIIRGSSKKLP